MEHSTIGSPVSTVIFSQMQKNYEIVRESGIDATKNINSKWVLDKRRIKNTKIKILKVAKIKRNIWNDTLIMV